MRYSSRPQKLHPWLNTAKSSEVVLLAVPSNAAQDAIRSAGNLSGKMLIDATNPLLPTLEGLPLGITTSAGEQVAQWAAGGKVVKAFNTVESRCSTRPDPSNRASRWALDKNRMTCHSIFGARAMAYRTTPKMALRKQARRQRLLDAAIRLFGRKGFHATTVPMIVRAASSSIGSFYFYFRNKEDIFAAVLESLGEKISAALNQAFARAGADPLVHMRAAVETLVQFLAEHPEEARVLIIESSGLGKRLEAVRRAIVQSHTRGVEHALIALRDRLPAMDTAVAASCWVGAVYEAVFHWMEQAPADRPPADQLARAIARFDLRAIGAPERMLPET